MRLSELWQKKQPTISLEFFPARTPEAEENLERVIDQLIFFEPDFVGVTFGAGGSTREGSRHLIDKILNDKGFDVVPYFAGYGLGPDDIEAVLESYQFLGVENVLVVRGDPPHNQPNFQPHPESMAHATDLLDFIRPLFPFCLGAAGYPEGHSEAESKEKDLEYLRMKVMKGAEFIITNYFYDNQYYFDYVERCRRLGIDVPILPSIMPVFNVKMMESLSKLCGATITPKLRAGLADLSTTDKRALLNFGIDFGFEQCKELLQAGVPGIHFYTMDRSPSTAGILAKLRREGVLPC